MKPNYGSLISVCTSSIQNAISERSLKSGYCSKTCYYDSNIYKSESERPSLQKILPNSTRIDKLYLGKFIPLRERKLLQKLMATRAAYDDAINDCLSMCVGEVKEPRPTHPCQCNFDDCESLMQLMSRTRIQKFKQSKSRLQHRLSKGFKKSLNKIKVSKQKYINMEDGACELVCDSNVCEPTECLTKNAKRQNKAVGRNKRKPGAVLAKGVTTSSSSTDSITQTRQKLNHEKIETRKEKKHHKHKAADAIETKVNVNVGSKKKKQITKKEGISQQKSVNKSQTRSLVKSASTISTAYNKETKMVGDNEQKNKLKSCLCNMKPKANIPKKSISKESMTYHPSVKLQNESTKTKTTKHKEHIIQTNSDHALKRCFCTLKLKAKRKLSKQVSKESMTLRVSATRKPKPQVQKEASSIDNRVNKSKQASKESMTSRSSAIYKQKVKEDNLAKNRLNLNLKLQKTLSPPSCECIKSIKRPSKASSTGSRKTRSALSLTPKYITPTTAKRAQSSIVTRKSLISKSKTRSNVKRIPREIKSSRSVSYRNRLLEVCIELPKGERTQSVSQTSPKYKPGKKFNRAKMAEEYGSQGDTSLHKSIVQEQDRKNNAGVGNALKRCFCTLKLHNAYKDKQKVYSSSYKEKEHGQQTDEINHETKELSTSSRRMKNRYSRRAVKIRSSVSFDIKLCRDVPPEAHKKLVQRNIKNKMTGPTRSRSSHESQTEIAKKRNKGALVKPKVKRCFCTLQLYEKQQQERTKKSRSKVYNVNRFTVTDTKPLSPKSRNTVLMKNESYSRKSTNSLNTELSTLRLNETKKFATSKPTFQVVRLSSDLSFKLTHKPLHPRKNIPFSNRFFYAMNVHNVEPYISDPKKTAACCDTCDYQKQKLQTTLSRTSRRLCTDIASKSTTNVAHIMLENKLQHGDKTKRCPIKQSEPRHRKPIHFYRQVGHTKSSCSAKRDCLKLSSSNQQRNLKNNYPARRNEQGEKYWTDNIHITSNPYHYSKKRNKNQYIDSKLTDVAAKPGLNKYKEKHKYVTMSTNKRVLAPKAENNVGNEIKDLITKHHILSHYDGEPNLYISKGTAQYGCFENNKRKHERFCNRRSSTKIRDVQTYVRTDKIPPKLGKQSPDMKKNFPRNIEKIYHCTQHNANNDESQGNIFFLKSDIDNEMFYQQPFTNQCNTNVTSNSMPDDERNISNNKHIKHVRIRDSQIITNKIKSTVSAINPFLKQCFNNIRFKKTHNITKSGTKNLPRKGLHSSKEDCNRVFVCNKTESTKRKSLLYAKSHENRHGLKNFNQCKCNECNGMQKRKKHSNKKTKVRKHHKSNALNTAQMNTYNDWNATPYALEPCVYFFDKCDPYNKELLKYASLCNITKIKSYKAQSGAHTIGQVSINDTHEKIRKTNSAMHESENKYNKNYSILLNKNIKVKHTSNCKITPHSRPNKNVHYAKSPSELYSIPYTPTRLDDRKKCNIKSPKTKSNIRNILRRCLNPFRVENDKLTTTQKPVIASKQQHLSKIRTQITDVSQIKRKRIARQHTHNQREIINVHEKHKHRLDTRRDMSKEANNQKSYRNYEVLTIFPYTPKKIHQISSKTHFISKKNYTGIRKPVHNLDTKYQTTKVRVKENIQHNTSIKTVFRRITQFFRKSKSHTKINTKSNDKPEVQPIRFNKAKKRYNHTRGCLKNSKSEVTNYYKSLHKKSKNLKSNEIPEKNTHYKKHRLLNDHKVKMYSRFQSGDAGVTKIIPTKYHNKNLNIISHRRNEITCMYCQAQYNKNPIESIKINYVDGPNPLRNITGARKVKDIKAKKLILMPACVKECNPKICETHMTRPCPCISPKIKTNEKKPKRKDCVCFDPTTYCGPLPIALTEEQRRLSRKPVKRGYNVGVGEIEGIRTGLFQPGGDTGEGCGIDYGYSDKSKSSKKGGLKSIGNVGNDMMSKNPIKNYITCIKHLSTPPPPPSPPSEPVEYMDPEPLFEMKLTADTMDLINPHDVMFKVQQLRSSLKYHPEELLKRLQKIHGLACRCCVCVAVEQAALKKQQTLQRKGKKKKMAEKERKKNLAEKLALLNRNPCICGSKRCQLLLNEMATNELKLREMKKIVPCVCGTKICAQERLKQDVKRNLITKESMKQSIREKDRQKRELKKKQDFVAKQARYKKEDKIRRKKRKKIEKNVTKRVKKQVRTTPDTILALESLVDIGKLGVTTVFNVLRSLYKKAKHPRDTYKTFMYSYKDRGRWKSSMQAAWVDSGATSVAKRIWLRITGMQKTQELKEKLNNSPAAGYFVHVFDPDEKRRLKYLKKHMVLKKKGLRKREPMDYQCSLFMASQRRRPYLSVYYMCPWFYPHCISLVNLWRQCTDILLFLLAVVVWSPCILCMELFRALVCCTGCTA